MRPEGGCRPEIRPPGKRCGAAAPKLSSQLHKQGCDPRMGPRCCTRSPTGRQKHSSAAACSHVGRSAGPRTTAPSERCCAPGDGHYNNVAIKEQNKKRQWFAAQGPDVALSLATNWRNGPFFPPLEQLAPIRGHTMRALVSPRTPRSHHPGCPLLLPATRPDLQAEHPAAPSAELGGGRGQQSGAVSAGGAQTVPQLLHGAITILLLPSRNALPALWSQTIQIMWTCQADASSAGEDPALRHEQTCAYRAKRAPVLFCLLTAPNSPTSVMRNPFCPTRT